jgi:hypothetical protein
LSSNNHTKSSEPSQDKSVKTKPKPILKPWLDAAHAFIRLDKIELYIDLTSKNIDLFNTKWHLIELALHQGTGGYGCMPLLVPEQGAHEDQQISDDSTTFTLEPEKQHWRYTRSAPITKVTVRGPIRHLDNPSPTRTKTVPDDFKGRLLPTRSQLLTLGQEQNWKPDFLGRIIISNKKKLCPAEYNQDVFLILDHLQTIGLDLVFRRVEVALDAVHTNTGRLLTRTQLPSYFKPDHMYHYPPIGCDENGKKKKPVKVKGPAPDGMPEYLGYGPKGRRDTRPNSEHPRGGRYVYHNHIHEVRMRTYGGVANIYRSECQIHRDILREMEKVIGQGKYVELLYHCLFRGVSRLLHFKKLNLTALRKKYPNTRHLGLKPLSVRGQVHRLLTRGKFKEKEIAPFLKDIKLPTLWMYLPDPEIDEYYQTLYRLHPSGELEPVDIDDQPLDALEVIPHSAEPL